VRPGRKAPVAQLNCTQSLLHIGVIIVQNHWTIEIALVSLGSHRFLSIRTMSRSSEKEVDMARSQLRGSQSWRTVWFRGGTSVLMCSISLGSVVLGCSPGPTGSVVSNAAAPEESSEIAGSVRAAINKAEGLVGIRLVQDRFWSKESAGGYVPSGDSLSPDCNTANRDRLGYAFLFRGLDSDELEPLLQPGFFASADDIADVFKDARALSVVECSKDDPNARSFGIGDLTKSDGTLTFSLSASGYTRAFSLKVDYLARRISETSGAKVYFIRSMSLVSDFPKAGTQESRVDFIPDSVESIESDIAKIAEGVSICSGYAPYSLSGLEVSGLPSLGTGRSYFFNLNTGRADGYEISGRLLDGQIDPEASLEIREPGTFFINVFSGSDDPQDDGLSNESSNAGSGLTWKFELGPAEKQSGSECKMQAGEPVLQNQSVEGLVNSYPIEGVELKL
jgi:hypothetical protein